MGCACGGAQGISAGGKALTVRKQSTFGMSPLLFGLGKGSLGGGSVAETSPGIHRDLGPDGRAGPLRSAVPEKWTDTSHRTTCLTSGEEASLAQLKKNLPSWPWQPRGHCPAVLPGHQEAPRPAAGHPAVAAQDRLLHQELPAARCPSVPCRPAVLVSPHVMRQACTRNISMLILFKMIKFVCIVKYKSLGS